MNKLNDDIRTGILIGLYLTACEEGKAIHNNLMLMPQYERLWLAAVDPQLRDELQDEADEQLALQNKL